MREREMKRTPHAQGVVAGAFLTWVNFVAALPAVFPVSGRDVRHALLVREGAGRR
jgi:hypothetical protein